MANVGIATNKKILELYNAMKSKDLILRPSFQRKLVWNNLHKEAFICTILENLPFPEIYFADGEIDLEKQRSKTLVVDGQQRLSTIYQYISGDESFVIKKIPKFDDLSPKEKTNFYDYPVVVRDLSRIDEEKIIEIFKRINSVQYALNAIEIQNALYEGEFISTAKNIMENSRFSELEILSETEYTRMKDWQYMLTIMATIEEGGYFNSTKELENYIIKYDEEYLNKNKIRDEISSAIDLILNSSLKDDSIWFRKSTMFTLLVELTRFKRKKGFFPKPKDLRITLNKLEDDIFQNKSADITKNKYAIFYKYIYSGTASRTARLKRGELLEEYFKKIK